MDRGRMGALLEENSLSVQDIVSNVRASGDKSLLFEAENGRKRLKTADFEVQGAKDPLFRGASEPFGARNLGAEVVGWSWTAARNRPTCPHPCRLRRWGATRKTN